MKIITLGQEFLLIQIKPSPTSQLRITVPASMAFQSTCIFIEL